TNIYANKIKKSKRAHRPAKFLSPIIDLFNRKFGLSKKPSSLVQIRRQETVNQIARTTLDQDRSFTKNSLDKTIHCRKRFVRSLIAFYQLHQRSYICRVEKMSTDKTIGPVSHRRYCSNQER